MVAFRVQIQVLHDAFRSHLRRLVNRGALEPFGNETRARDSRAAAKDLEARFGDAVAIAPHLDAYHRTLIQRSHLAGADVLAVQRANPPRRPDAIQHFIRVTHLAP